MKNLKTQIEIKASPQRVWEVLMDFNNYSQWNSFILKASGDPVVGKTIQVTIQPKRNQKMEFTPKVLKLDSSSEFRWKGKLGLKGVFDGEHYFKLESLDQNTTLFTHGEVFSGILSPIIYPMIMEDTQKGFIRMNNELKIRSENH